MQVGMGCGLSQNREQESLEKAPKTNGRKQQKGLKLQSCNVELSCQQLNRIDLKFQRLLEQNVSADGNREKQVDRLGVVVERLVQRLVTAAGDLDPRFASKFLITLDTSDSKVLGSRLKYRYLVRLDAVSTPSIDPERIPPVRILQGAGRDSLPAGYARIIVLGDYLEVWGDLINHHGHLRRDKIQERFMELLATAAGRPEYPMSPLEVDESRFCGSPGKVVDPLSLHHILKLPPYRQCFYGPGESDEVRFPDPRDFRIAIVEGVPEVTLHISFLSPAGNSLTAEEDVEIVLTICIGVADWPQQCDFPSRLPLDHVDVLLGFKSAQTGFVLVPSGPHHTIRCEDRTSVWEIRTPAAFTLIEQHYSETSVVGRCSKILNILMDLVRSRGVKTLHRHILKTLLLWELERRPRLGDWTPRNISRRVMSILDTLTVCLRQQHLRSYMFPTINLLLQPCVAEEDYRSDAEILETYLGQLYQDRGSFQLMEAESSVQDHLEAAMLEKWNHVIGNISPPNPALPRRLSKSSSSVRYSRRQMEYIAVLFREILKLRQIQQKSLLSSSSARSQQMDGDFLDEFFYLLQTVFEQAKTRAWNFSASDTKRKLREILDTYDVSTAMIIDNLKRDANLVRSFSTDMQLVAKVMECLHSAANSDSKILGPILQPYLNQLYKGSQENCWFLQDWLQRNDDSEAIGAFTRLVLTEQLDPLQGLLDCVAKGWIWAKHALDMLKNITDAHSADVLIGHRADSPSAGLRMVFAPSVGQTFRCTLHLTSGQSLEVAEYLREENEGRTPLSTLRKGRRPDNRYATIRSFSDSLFGDQKNATWGRSADTWLKLRTRSTQKPVHGKLRDGSPLTIASMASRRHGTHRGLGSIVQALISLQKLTVLQEISVHLPDDERGRVLSDIQKLSKEVQRISVSRRRSDGALGSKNRFSFKRSPKKSKSGVSDNEKSATLPNSKKREQTFESREIYKSRNELEICGQGAEEDNERKLGGNLKTFHDDSLIGTCRILRNQQRPQEKTEYTTIFQAPRLGKYAEKSPSPFTTNTIQTPFYIKASTLPSRQPEMSEI